MYNQLFQMANVQESAKQGDEARDEDSEAYERQMRNSKINFEKTYVSSRQYQGAHDLNPRKGQAEGENLEIGRRRDHATEITSEVNITLIDMLQ